MLEVKSLKYFWDTHEGIAVVNPRGAVIALKSESTGLIVGDGVETS